MQHVAPDEPGRLCASTSTFLLYEDQSQKPRQLKWLDCTKKYPTTPTIGINVTYTRHASLVDICCVQNRNQQLLVTARGFHGVDAYDRISSKLEWSVIGKLPGMTKGICAWAVTTDGCGQIFVGDKGNTCVQVVASDGLHLRTIKKPEFGKIWGVCWMERCGYIICSHKKDERYYISAVRETTDQEREVLSEIPADTSGTMEMETEQEQSTQVQVAELSQDMDISDGENSEGEIIVVDNFAAPIVTDVDQSLERTGIDDALVEDSQVGTFDDGSVQDKSLKQYEGNWIKIFHDNDIKSFSAHR